MSETREDGSLIVRQSGELGAYPATMSERVEHWAQETPERTWMAERTVGRRRLASGKLR